jgi:hypothetical protein
VPIAWLTYQKAKKPHKIDTRWDETKV